MNLLHSALSGGAWLPFAALCVCALSLYLWRSRQVRKLTTENADLKLRRDALAGQVATITERFKSVLDVDAEKQKVEFEMNGLRSKIEAFGPVFTELQARADAARKKIALYDDDLEAIDFGLYKKHYTFDTSEKFKAAIEQVREKQKAMIKDDVAVVGEKQWTINGNAAEGRQMIKRLTRLLLRAFNGEAEAILSNVTWNNASRMSERLENAYEAINKMAESYQVAISRRYIDLKLEELRLTFEYQDKQKAEKDEQRRIQEQMREEERAQREIEKALKEAQTEEERFQKALTKARDEVTEARGAELEKMNAKIALLETQLKEAQANKERAISRAQLTRSGHVYIISNIGSFGENRFKIGMTRRLDPMDRVKELGDASVPFEFDVHAIIYTEDAPGLETKLHNHFEARRMNLVNDRKEFFEVTIDELSAAIAACDASIELVKVPEAREYRETLSLRAEKSKAAAPQPAPANDAKTVEALINTVLQHV